MIYPISYSFPKELMATSVSIKTCHTAEHNYQFTDSTEYLQNYSRGIFANTGLKCGWDCLRHYEILSQGTIPHFKDLEQCPAKTMVPFPKQQILDLNTKYWSSDFDTIMKNGSSTLYDDLNSLLTYTRSMLTTEVTATYLLHMSGHKNASKILYITNADGMGDYMYETLGHGLKTITGGTCHVYPEFGYWYKGFPLEDTLRLYGKGFNYTRLLPDSWKQTFSDDIIWSNIRERYYDMIVVYLQDKSDTNIPFTTGDTNMMNFYAPNEISVVCGRDCDPYWSEELKWHIRRNHECSLKKISDGRNIFIRELGD